MITSCVPPPEFTVQYYTAVVLLYLYERNVMSWPVCFRRKPRDGFFQCFTLRVKRIVHAIMNDKYVLWRNPIDRVGNTYIRIQSIHYFILMTIRYNYLFLGTYEVKYVLSSWQTTIDTCPREYHTVVLNLLINATHFSSRNIFIDHVSYFFSQRPF